MLQENTPWWIVVHTVLVPSNSVVDARAMKDTLDLNAILRCAVPMRYGSLLYANAYAGKGSRENHATNVPNLEISKMSRKSSTE
jgi:hypothetical protein